MVFSSAKNPRLFLSEKDGGLREKASVGLKGLTDKERSKAVVIHPGKREQGTRCGLWSGFGSSPITFQRHSQFPDSYRPGPGRGAGGAEGLGGMEWGIGSAAPPSLVKGLSLLELAFW